MDITAGLFSSTTESFTISVPDHVLEWIKDAEINFDIVTTNALGNLIISWNGAELFNAKSSPGDHTVKIKKSSKQAKDKIEKAGGKLISE